MKTRIATMAVAAVLLAFPGAARAEWFYLGLQAGGQYLDLDAMSGGQVFNQAIDQASADITSMGDFRPEPTHYSAENAFVYGGYAGVQLSIVRVGARVTHSFMDVVAEDGTGTTDVSFGLNLVTALIEAQVQIPLWIFRPFVGVGLGYAFLGSETTIVSGGQEGQSDLGTNCFDAMAEVGLDVNIGRWFALGAAAHFSFIGFYYEDPENPEATEAAWGFATDYLVRATLRL